MKLFIVTQVVDSTNVALGFFVEWINAFRKHPSVSGVTVASFDGSNEKVSDVEVHRVTKQGKWSLITSMWALLRSSDWDVLFVHMTPVWCLACWPIVVLKRKKMVLWYTHGSSSLALRIACLLCDDVYTATAGAFPIRSSHVFAVGHGIPERFGSVDRISGYHHRYLADGRYTPRKRVIESLELFSKIHAIDPQASLTWIGSSVGDFVYETEVDQAVQRLGLASCVRMTRGVPFETLPALYGESDLLLHLSATGSLDKAPIQALMAGCAVFSTNPATAEGLGTEWFWSGPLDDAAAREALDRAQRGVSSECRQKITSQYGLTSFIDRLCKTMTVL